MGLVSDTLRLRAVRSRAGFRSLLETLHRWNRPVLSLPGGRAHLIVGATEVEAVMRRPDDFMAGHPKASKILFQPFLLGMDRTDAYRAQRAELEEVVLGKLGSERFERIAEQIATREATRIEEQLRSQPRVDLSGGYTDQVVYGSMAEFLGLPAAPARVQSAVLRSEPGVPTLALWIRKLGMPIGYAEPESFAVEEAARQVARELRAYVVEGLRAAEASRAAASDSIFHLLAEPPPRDVPESEWRRDHEDRVFARVAGLLAASFALAKSLNYCVDEILRRPVVRDRVADLARARDYTTLALYVWEALRFRPTFPVLVRYAPRDTQLRLRTGETREIAAGSTLQLVTCAALFDPRCVPRPEVFLPSRFADDADRLLGLLFGFPERDCLGRALAAVALPRMVGALFRCEALGRARAGRAEWDGLAIDRYWIEAAASGSGAPASSASATLASDAAS